MTGSAVAVQGANTVDSRDIKPRSVKRSDLARNSVNSSKVLNRSLRSEDFALGQLPRGPKGQRGLDGPRGPRGFEGPAGATRVTGNGASVAALEREGADGIDSVAARGWEGAQDGTRLRVSRATPNFGGKDFLITPYQYGMALEYEGVVEAWVKEFSINGAGYGDGGILWVDNDDDSGGIRMHAENSGGDGVWGEIAMEKFYGGSNGPLRLRTVNPDDAIEIWNGRSDTAVRQAVLGKIGPSGEIGVSFGSNDDTNLYRWAADVLKTDDKLISEAGLGVGNSEAATNPGSVVRKMEVFDANGASLGFVPIYDSID
jgi:hypothetical protein